MKKQLQKMFLIGTIGMFAFTTVKSQSVSTFESLTLAADTFWNGKSQPMGTTFADGDAIFKNHYDTAFGGYWSGGWAYSNITDSSTAGYMNMYAARPGIGYNNSEKYIVGQQGAMIKLNGAAVSKVVNGLYVTNSTYAALSMRNGDAFAKKFGGVSGNDSDWYKLTIHKYYGGALITDDSVDFYLADYRFANNSEDYIVNNWEYVDLSSLGNVDSLVFKLTSSDVGQFGMNTPAFFCVDNFNTSKNTSVASKLNNSNLISLFPNPTSNSLHLNIPEVGLNATLVEIFDATGRIVYTETVYSSSSIISVETLPVGIYHLKVNATNFTVGKSFIKQ